MNFNFIATLLAACATLTAAVTAVKKDKLVNAPPVRGKTGKGGKQSKPVPARSSSRPAKSSLQIASSSAEEANRICTRKLEEIVYGPSSNVKTYLSKIAAEMRADIQVIMNNFAAGNLDYIRTYVNKYNVLITVGGPFGSPVIVTPTFNAYTVPFKNVGTARTYAGVDGFYSDPTNQYYNYQFSLMSINGQYITFVISLPFTSMTLTPTDNCRK